MGFRGRFVVAFFMVTGSAHAYCRSRTCEAKLSCSDHPDRCCDVGPGTCASNGKPLAWPASCVSYSVQEDGSARLGISADVLAEMVDDAFDQWLSGDCEGEPVSLAVDYRGKAECDRPEYNQEKNSQNANIWMFRDDLVEGPAPGEGALSAAAVAVTTVMFDEISGDILDVDVELLSGRFDFTLDDEEAIFDLRSVVNHEAGHFLGLDHSFDPGSTMASRYYPGETHKRDLAPDDLAGICEAYPAGRALPWWNHCEPRGGYSGECYQKKGCGCSVPGRGGSSSLAWWGSLIFVGAAWRRLRVRAG